MKLSRVITGASVAVLLIMITCKQLWWWPIENTTYNLIWYVMQVAPLMLCIRGFLNGGLTATFMLTLLSQLYFLHGVVVMVDAHTRVYGGVEVFVSLTLCAASALLVRRIRQENPPTAAELGE